MSAAERPPRAVDSHAHLDDEAFDADRDEVVRRAAAAGVDRIVNVGYRPERWETTERLQERFPGIRVMLGIHPRHAEECTPKRLAELRSRLVASDAVALGEIGLDYFRSGPDAATQRAAFVRQLDLGRELGLPIVIHQRSAEADLIETLATRDDLPPLVLHSFEGSRRLAELARDRGFFVGVGGLATRSGSAPLREVLASIPIDRLLLETDSPYLAPAGAPRRRNEPSHLPIIAERVAPLWGIDRAELLTRTARNAETLFGLEVAAAGKVQ